MISGVYITIAIETEFGLNLKYLNSNVNICARFKSNAVLQQIKRSTHFCFQNETKKDIILKKKFRNYCLLERNYVSCCGNVLKGWCG